MNTFPALLHSETLDVSLKTHASSILGHARRRVVL